MDIYHCRKKLFILSILIYSSFCISAQEADWNSFANPKERADTMRKYILNLLRQQKIDNAITLAKTALTFSKKALLDSAEAADLYLLGNAYRYKSSYDSALYFLKKSRDITIQKKLITLQAAVDIETYGIYNRLGKADSAEVFIGRLKEIAPTLDSNSREAAKIEMYLGHNEKHQAKYADALAHYYNALRKFTFLKDSANQGTIYVSLANVLVITGQLNDALNYHRLAAALFAKLDRRTELLNELQNITDLYYTSGQLDSAEVSIRRALPIAEQVNDKYSQAYVYVHLGNIYKRRKNFPEAEAYLLKANSLSGSLDDETIVLEINQAIGEMYMSEKQFAKAQPYLEKHLAIAERTNNREEIIEASWNLADNEYALHHFAKAYEYKNLYSIYRDSAYQESSAKSIAEMEAKYQAEKKEKEITLLKKDQQLDKLSLQKQANFRAGAIVFLLLLLLIAFLLVNRYRIVQRAKRLIEIEKMRNQIARDLHDDIGSNLTSIHILSKMAGEQAVARGELLTSPSLEKIKDRSSEIMDSVSDIVWTINPLNDNLGRLLVRMKEFAEEILTPVLSYDFIEEGDFSTLKPGIKLKRDVYLFFKESLTNAVKYSRGTAVVIKLVARRQELTMQISDNGIGFNPDSVTGGNGLANLKSRAKLMNAAVTIDAAPEKGTVITLKVPIT